MSDPGISYRTREEVNQMRTERDCIETLRQRILKNKLASEDELKTIERDIKKQVDEEAEFGKNAKELPTEEVTNDIYSDQPPPFIRNVEYPTSISTN